MEVDVPSPVFTLKELSPDEMNNLVEVHRRHAQRSAENATRTMQRFVALCKQRDAAKTGAISKRDRPQPQPLPQHPVCAVQPNNWMTDFPDARRASPQRPPRHSRWGPPPSTPSSESDSTWFARERGVFDETSDNQDRNDYTPPPRFPWRNRQNYEEMEEYTPVRRVLPPNSTVRRVLLPITDDLPPPDQPSIVGPPGWWD